MRIDRRFKDYRSEINRSRLNRVCKALTILAVIVLIILAVINLTGCGTADISDYAEETIAVTGLGDDFTVTPAELMAMKCVTRQDTGATEKAGTVVAYGPLLPTFLENYGYTIEDIDRVRVYCKDEYKVVLKKEYLTDYEIVLSVASGADPMDEKFRPLRLLIPEAESSKWAYGITKLEFVTK